MRKEARARAKTVHEALVKGEVEAAGMKLQDAKAYTNALRLLEPTGVSLETVCLEYAKAFQALKGRASVVQVVEDYMSRHDGVIVNPTPVFGFLRPENPRLINLRKPTEGYGSLQKPNSSLPIPSSPSEISTLKSEIPLQLSDHIRPYSSKCDFIFGL